MHYIHLYIRGYIYLSMNKLKFPDISVTEYRVEKLDKDLKNVERSLNRISKSKRYQDLVIKIEEYNRVYKK